MSESNLKIQSPRTILSYPNGIQQLSELIQIKTNYVPQDEALTLLCNSMLMCVALLAEGERGSGKTLMANSLAEACGLKKFFVPCSEATRAEELLYEWDRDGQDIYRREEVAEGRNSREIRDELWTEKFLIFGKVLEAFDYASRSLFPPILVFDEIDKMPQGLQGMLLEVLQAGYVTVNRLKPVGEIGMLRSMEPERRYASHPIILFTSNDHSGDKIIEPLRSRTVLCFMKPPSGFELIKVLHSQVSGVGKELLKEMARLQKGLSAMPLKSRPALREYVRFLDFVRKSGQRSISTEFLYKNTGFLAANTKDYEQIQDKAEMLVRSYISVEDKEIDGWVDKAVEQRNRAIANVAELAKKRN